MVTEQGEIAIPSIPWCVADALDGKFLYLFIRYINYANATLALVGECAITNDTVNAVEFNLPDPAVMHPNPTIPVSTSINRDTLGAEFIS